MDADKTFEEIRSLISQGRNEEAVELTGELAESSSDPMVGIKCLSLLKVVGETERSKPIVSKVASNLPDDPQMRIQIAGALRGLEYPSTAYGILKAMDQDDTVRRLSCMCLEDMEEYELARMR